MAGETGSVPTFSLYPSAEKRYPSRQDSRRRLKTRQPNGSMDMTPTTSSPYRSPSLTRDSRRDMKGPAVRVSTDVPAPLRLQMPTEVSQIKRSKSQSSKPNLAVSKLPQQNTKPVSPPPHPPPRTRLPAPPSSPGLYDLPTPIFPPSDPSLPLTTAPKLSKTSSPKSSPVKHKKQPSTSTTMASPNTASPSTVFSASSPSSQTTVTTIMTATPTTPQKPIRAKSPKQISTPLPPSESVQIDSIFPPYNHELPLQQQQYYPSPQASPTRLPREQISRAPYSPDSIDAQFSHSAPPVRPLSYAVVKEDHEKSNVKAWDEMQRGYLEDMKSPLQGRTGSQYQGQATLVQKSAVGSLGRRTAAAPGREDLKFPPPPKRAKDRRRGLRGLLGRLGTLLKGS